MTTISSNAFAFKGGDLRPVAIGLSFENVGGAGGIGIAIRGVTSDDRDIALQADRSAE